MHATGRGAYAQSVDRVIGLCRTDCDERAMRQALLDEVGHAVGFDAFAWLLTDPESEVGCAPLADVPCLPELPRLIRLKYLTTVNRWTALTVPVATLRDATSGWLEHSLLWREMLVGYGVQDIASLVFRDAFGCWGFLDLWRMGTGAHFADAEKAYLGAVAPPVTEALRRCQARTFKEATSAAVPAGPVVLVLSPELEVRAQTAATDDYLRALVPTEPDRGPIPAGAYNVAAQLLAAESGIDDHPPSARVRLDGSTWVTLRAARVGSTDRTAAQDIAVTIERTSPADRRSLFGQAHALSAREAELVAYLAEGADTKAIAERMFISLHTVQDHLKSIFAKTDARNRRTLLARLSRS